MKRPTEPDRWYFAYGSNLAIDRKERRTGTIRQALRCRLPDCRVVFNKKAASGIEVYANITPARHEAMWGVAYLCDASAIAAQDEYEGVAGGHYKHAKVSVIADGSRTLHALTYVAGSGFVVQERQPSEAYLQTILSGARYHHLPEEYVRALEQYARSLAHGHVP